MSLGGNIGGGSFIDFVGQIYELGLDPRFAPVILYLPLANQKNHDPENKRKYYQNSYASLLELNGIMVGKYSPTNPLTGEPYKAINEELFRAIYLYEGEKASNENEEKKLLLEKISLSLYHKIYTKNFIESHWDLERLEITPPNGFEFYRWPHRFIPEYGMTPEKISTKNPERSRNFMSFGISQITYETFSRVISKNNATTHPFLEGKKCKSEISARNIVEHIKSIFNEKNSELEQAINEEVEKATILLCFDKNEKAKVGPIPESTPDQYIWRAEYVTIFPSIAENGYGEIKEKINRAFSKQSCCHKILENSGVLDKIIMIGICGVIPLRTVLNIRYLRSAYKESSLSPAIVFSDIHIEDVKDIVLPDLYFPSMEEITTQFLPYFLIAPALGIIQEDLVAEPRGFVFTSFDPSTGLEVSMKVLGCSIIESAHSSSVKTCLEIYAEVLRGIAVKFHDRNLLIKKTTGVYEKEQQNLATKKLAETENRQRLERAFAGAMKILAKYTPPTERPGEQVGLAAI